MVYQFFDKNASGRGIKNENISNEELAEELQKPIIWKFKKIKVRSSFIDNICGADLAEMQLISKFHKGIRFLLCVIDIFNKYTWVICFKVKKGTKITNAFQKILDKSNRKSKKIWVDKGNRSMKLFTQNTNIEKYSTHNEGIFVIS